MAESTTASVRVVLLGPSGGGKTALATAMTSGQSVKGQAFKATAEAAVHTLRVPVQGADGPLVIEISLTDLPGDADKLAAALAKDPKILLEADLAVLCIPPTGKDQYVAAVKALDTFKAKGGGKKALLFLTKCDEAKQIDQKTVKNFRHWVQVPERDTVLRMETLSSVDTDPEQIRVLLKALALDAHKAAGLRKAAEAEALKAAVAAKAGAKACCTIS